MTLKGQSHEVFLAYHMIIVTRHLQGTEHIVQETLVQVEGDQLQKQMLETVPRWTLILLWKCSGSVHIYYGSGRPIISRTGSYLAIFCGHWKKTTNKNKTGICLKTWKKCWSRRGKTSSHICSWISSASTLTFSHIDTVVDIRGGPLPTGSYKENKSGTRRVIYLKKLCVCSIYVK